MNKSSSQKFVENLTQTILSILKIMLLSNKTNPIKSKSICENCLILGNGPSLSQSIDQLADTLAETDLFCVNHFAETDLYPMLKPRNYVLNAPEMWLDKVEPFHLTKGEGLFDAITNNTKWDLNLFIPSSARKYKRWKSKIRQNKLIKIKYFNTTPVNGFKWFVHFSIKNGLGLPRPHNVLIPAVALACNLRYRNIYLLGAENSIFKEISVTDQNEVLLTQKHFYDTNNASARPMDKLGKGNRKMHEVLQKFVYSFQGYWILQDYATRRHIKIFNATPNSFIDAFAKIKIDELTLKN